MARQKLLKARSIRRTAMEIKRYRIMMKILPITAGLLTAVVAVTFVVSSLYNKYGAFTVMVEKANFVHYGLSLCETPNFSSPSARLNSKASENITNISKNDLPGNLNTVNGEHNGTNYIAYTFFLRNMGSSTVSVGYNLIIANMTMGIEEAVRVRVYSGEYDDSKINHTDSYVDYAKTRTDGNGPEEDTTEFLTNSTIMQGELLDFEPEAVHRFTVVIWLEGDDSECVDDIIGGAFKVDMNFEILNVGGDENAAEISEEAK